MSFSVDSDDGWLVVGEKSPRQQTDVTRRRVILPPFSRRLRHLNGVIFRHVTHKGALQRTLYRLYKDTSTDTSEDTTTTTTQALSDEDLLYESEVVADTVNPTWRNVTAVLRDNNLKAELQTTKFIVGLYVEGGEEIARYNIDLGSVKFVCVSTTELKLQTKDKNRLLLDFHDGVFIPAARKVATPQIPPASPKSEASTSAPSSPLAVPPPPPPLPSSLENFEYCTMDVPVSKEPVLDQALPQSLGDVRCDITRLVSVSNALTAAQEKTKIVREAIAAKMEAKQEQRALLLEGEHRRFRVRSLKAKLAEAEKRLKEKQDKLIKDKEHVHSEREGLKAAAVLMRQRKAEEEEVLKKIKQMKDSDMKRSVQIVNRKKRLVRVLRAMFTIEVNHMSDALTICGMELGRDNHVSDEAATALGYVTHCIQLLACVWGVSLRHPVIPIASRSYIQESYLDGSAREETTLRSPLFCARSNTADKSRCIQSVMLLNSNLRQLLQVCLVNEVINLLHFSSIMRYVVVHRGFLFRFCVTERRK